MPTKKQLTVNDLRNVLLDQVSEITNGNADLKKAKTISALSQNVMNTYKIQLLGLKQMGIKTTKTTLPGLL